MSSGISGTIVMTITYGFCGYTGFGLISSVADRTASLYVEEGQDIVDQVDRLKIFLIDSLRDYLTSEENRRKFGDYSLQIFGLYHVISQSYTFIQEEKQPDKAYTIDFKL